MTTATVRVVSLISFYWPAGIFIGIGPLSARVVDALVRVRLCKRMMSPGTPLVPRTLKNYGGKAVDAWNRRSRWKFIIKKFEKFENRMLIRFRLYRMFFFFCYIRYSLIYNFFNLSFCSCNEINEKDALYSVTRMIISRRAKCKAASDLV